jgi:4-oxalocrotonate tautomerase
MPLVHIALSAKRGQRYRRAIADAVHAAMVETIDVPPDDRFQIITGPGEETLIFDHDYLGIARSAELAIIRITLRRGRSAAQKQRLYGRIVDKLRRDPGLRPPDVLITLVENEPIDWSFGNGEAQLAPPRDRLGSETTPAARLGTRWS